MSAETLQVRLLEALFRGDSQTVLDVFAGEPTLDAPRYGRIVGPAEARELTSAWASSFNVEPGDHIDTYREIVTPNGATTEVIANVRTIDGQEVRLPIALAGEIAPDGRLIAVRIYHALRAITGAPAMRPTPFPIRKDSQPIEPEDVPDVNSVYFRGLVEQDMELTMSAFEEDVTVEAGGLAAEGRENLRAIYVGLIADKIRLYKSETWDDGHIFALEWNNGVGNLSGLAAYERGESGRIKSIHMYDDINLSAIPGLTWKRA